MVNVVVVLGGLSCAVEVGFAETLAYYEADAGHYAGAERVEEYDAEVGGACVEKLLHAGAGRFGGGAGGWVGGGGGGGGGRHGGWGDGDDRRWEVTGRRMGWRKCAVVLRMDEEVEKVGARVAGGGRSEEPN